MAAENANPLSLALQTRTFWTLRLFLSSMCVICNVVSIVLFFYYWPVFCHFFLSFFFFKEKFYFGSVVKERG